MREHYEAAERQSGVRPPELDGPECPLELGYLWGWYVELANARGGGFGPDPVSFTEISAWAALTRNSPTPFETGCLRAIDEAFFRVKSEQERAEAAKRKR